MWMKVERQLVQKVLRSFHISYQPSGVLSSCSAGSFFFFYYGGIMRLLLAVNAGWCICMHVWKQQPSINPAGDLCPFGARGQLLVHFSLMLKKGREAGWFLDSLFLGLSTFCEFGCVSVPAEQQRGCRGKPEGHGERPPDLQKQGHPWRSM